MFQQLWDDTQGGIVSPEFCLVATILVIGVIVGIASLSREVREEIEDLTAVVESIDYFPMVSPEETTDTGDSDSATDTGDTAPGG